MTFSIIQTKKTTTEQVRLLNNRDTDIHSQEKVNFDGNGQSGHLYEVVRIALASKNDVYDKRYKSQHFAFVK